MKYITYYNGNVKDIIIFSDYNEHAAIAREFGIMDKLIGAGFVSFDQRICYGESVSLGVKSHPNDTNIWLSHDDSD